MKLTKEMLKKLKKDELIDLVLQLQEDKILQQNSISIYDKYRKKRVVIYDVVRGDEGEKVWAEIADEYLIVIKSEHITPSGYARSGTLEVVYDKELTEEDRNLIVEKGFTKKTVKEITNW